MALIIGGALVTAVVILFGLSRRLDRNDEMGSVSGQWLAEYRQDRES